MKYTDWSSGEPVEKEWPDDTILRRRTPTEEAAWHEGYAYGLKMAAARDHEHTSECCNRFTDHYMGIAHGCNGL